MKYNPCRIPNTKPKIFKLKSSRFENHLLSFSMTKLYFLLFYLSFRLWLAKGYICSSSKLLSYILQREYDFSFICEAMYLLILPPMFPAGFICLEFTGMSFVDLLVSLNFIVASNILLALNFDMPAPS
jgi:hypothetical protein